MSKDLYRLSFSCLIVPVMRMSEFLRDLTEAEELPQFRTANDDGIKVSYITHVIDDLCYAYTSTHNYTDVRFSYCYIEYLETQMIFINDTERTIKLGNNFIVSCFACTSLYRIGTQMIEARPALNRN